MVVFPNAKINLGLNITEKRPDGFHNLESCFYPVQWCDMLEIIESPQLKFTSSGIGIPGNPNDNLCLKAYELLAEDYDIPPVHIHLHKIIPIGAGLGGGSADASFTLKLLNTLFNLGISNEQLEVYAAQLGSDCPFFIQNKPTFATGRGEIFDNISLDLKDKYILLIKPDIHISTKEAYAGVKPAKAEVSVKNILEQLPVAQWKDQLHNDFEDSIFPNHPEIQLLKHKLYGMGAVYASMSGSGATVFGIFNEEPEWNEPLPKGYAFWKGKL